MSHRKLLVVSGANGAVGAEIVRIASQRDEFLVLGLGRQPALLAAHKNAHYCQFDLTSNALTAPVRELFEQEAYSEISWIHAVGAFSGYGLFSKEQLVDVDRIIHGNFLTTAHALHFWLNEAVRLRRGRFIAFSSVAASKDFPFSATFNASKIGVESLIRSISNEVLIEGVTAITIALPTIQTPVELALKPLADHAHWLAPVTVAEIALSHIDDPLGKYLRGSTIPYYDPSVTFHGESVASRYGKNGNDFSR